MLRLNFGGFALIASLAISLAACGDIRVPSNNGPGRQVAEPPCNRGQAGPGKVYVCRGDTLISLAQREDVTVANLMKANGLSDGRIYSGTTLVLPDEYVYVVSEGDTLLDISRRTNVPTDRIVAANDLTNPDRLLPETRLAIPGQRTLMAAAPANPRPTYNRRPPTVSYLPSGQASSRPSPGTTRPSSVTIGPGATTRPTITAPAPAPSQDTAALTPSRPAEPVVTRPQPRQRPAAEPARSAPATKAPATKAPAAASPAGLSFLLPVEGKILSDFGPKSGGLHNDGINIAAPRGTAIRAAAEGTVAYAGDGLPGFGNLILIKHGDGWTSAYAHADSMAVKRGDGVRQGQTIGEVGDTGSVNEPQLHFELRRHDRAIDPKTLVR